MGQDRYGIHSVDGGRTWIDSVTRRPLDPSVLASGGTAYDASVIGNIGGSAPSATGAAALNPFADVPPDILFQANPYSQGGLAEDAPPVRKRKNAFASWAGEEEFPAKKKGKGGVIRRLPAGLDEEEPEPVMARRYVNEEDDYEDAGDEEDSAPVRRARKTGGDEAMAGGGKLKGPLGLKPPKGVAVKPIFAATIVLGKKVKPGAKKKGIGGVTIPLMQSRPRRLAKGGAFADPHLRGGVNTNGRHLSNKRQWLRQYQRTALVQRERQRLRQQERTAPWEGQVSLKNPMSKRKINYVLISATTSASNARASSATSRFAR
jgi:hypothetical protein